MINLENLYHLLKDSGIEFISGVPDTLLNDFCLGLDIHWDKKKHILAANEGNAIALATGYHLATKTIPLVYMQNSGVGNAMNPLISLTDKNVYSVPMVLLIGWRGEPGSGDWPQHQRQGELSPVLLESLNIPYKIIDDNTALDFVEWSIKKARKINQPTALLVKKNVLAKKEKSGFDSQAQLYNLSREEAIKLLINELPCDTVYVASTGRITRELHAIRATLKQTHENDFLNVGAMGHALSIATSIAVAKPNKTVVCLDGDAASLMHMGSMPVSASLGLNNLIHIVLNNGVHESVGGQKSVGYSANLTGIAMNAGYETPDNFISNKNDIRDIFKILKDPNKSKFIELRINKGMRDDMPILKVNTIKSKEEFMDNINSKKT